MLCDYSLYIDLFIMCIANVIVFLKCLLNLFAICFTVVAVLVLNVSVFL